MNEDQKDRFGRIVDRIDNYASALKMPILDSIHVEVLREALPEIRDELKTLYIETTGEDPWA